MSSPQFNSYTAVLSNKEHNDENVLVKLEKGFLIMFRHNSENTEIYKNFDDQISTYLTKINGPSKDIILQLLNRKKLMIGTHSKQNTNLLGCVSLTEANKLLFCAINAPSFDVEYTDGLIGNIEEAICQYYYQIIRYVVRVNTDISKNPELHELCINYLTFLFLKVFKTPTIVDKKVDILKYAIAILFYKHFIKMDDSLAKEKALSMIPANMKNEIKAFNFSKYTDIKDIIKIAVDLKIVFDTPNGITYQMLNTLKVVSFLAITTTIDHLIASIIASLTSTDYYRPLLINRPIQENLEKIIVQHFNSIKYEEISNFHISSVKKDV